MMSRITHVLHQPKVVYYWDYYILCRLHVAAALALQRLEYWDGTKEDAIVHEGAPIGAQNSPRWIYKTQEELHWELMGVAGEKGVTALTRFLQDDLHYLVSRHHPRHAFDRKKQYAFQASLIQQHLDYLAALLNYFQQHSVRLAPVYYAVELLTREQVTIEELSIEGILGKLIDMRQDSRLPTFLKQELAKGTVTPEQLAAEGFPFRSFAEWKALFQERSTPQRCGKETPALRNGLRKNAACTMQECGSNSSNYAHLFPSLITQQKEAEESINEPVLQDLDATTAEITMSKTKGDPVEEVGFSLAILQETRLSASVPLASSVVSGKEQAPSPLTEEAMVQCWESLLGRGYESQMREVQLRAARALLRMDLSVPLSCALLQRLYETYFDAFWKKTYGLLHLSHLIQVEKSSGQVRIVRWIKRLSFQEAMQEARNGHSPVEAAVPPPSEQTKSVQDSGGFERFREGDDPNDDLEAVVKRLQAEGKLPALVAG